MGRNDDDDDDDDERDDERDDARDDENVGDINASRVNRVPPVAFSPNFHQAHFNQHQHLIIMTIVIILTVVKMRTNVRVFGKVSVFRIFR